MNYLTNLITDFLINYDYEFMDYLKDKESLRNEIKTLLNEGNVYPLYNFFSELESNDDIRDILNELESF